MKTSQEEIQVEDEGELVFTEMEEVGKRSRELLKIIDKMEMG